MTAAIEAAPAAEAKRPAQLTPPDVPTGTGLPVTIERGRRLARDPISVAQVSAVAVASAPPNPESTSR